LPENDASYPKRWSLIKAGLSRKLKKTEKIGASRRSKRERGIWQRRYWEHQIRDETDMARHIDYIHFNPMKHGLVRQPSDWRYSTIHRYIESGLIPADWGGRVEDVNDDRGERR